MSSEVTLWGTAPWLLDLYEQLSEPRRSSDLNDCKVLQLSFQVIENVSFMQTLLLLWLAIPARMLAGTTSQAAASAHTKLPEARGDKDV